MKITIEIYREVPGCSYASDYPAAGFEIEKDEWDKMSDEDKENRCGHELLKFLSWWYREKRETKITVEYSEGQE